MLKYWLSVLLIGITLILVACSESPNSSGGVVMSKGEGGGMITINVEQKGGHGAIEVYLASGGKRIAVAQGQCTGPDSCKETIQTGASAADGIRVVWSAKNLGPKDYYMSSAYACSPASTGCSSNRTDYMYRSNKEGTQVEATFKVDTTNGSITIGGSFSEDAPAGASTGGVNYCYTLDGFAGNDLVEGEVRGGGAACQAAVNEWAASCGLTNEGGALGPCTGGVLEGNYLEYVALGCYSNKVVAGDEDMCAGDEGPG